MGEDPQGIFRGDFLGMFDDDNVRIRGAQPFCRRGDLRRTDRSVFVEQLSLEIVGGDLVEIGDAESAHAGGGKIQRGGTPQATGADDQHASARERALPRNSSSASTMTDFPAPVSPVSTLSPGLSSSEADSTTAKLAMVRCVSMGGEHARFSAHR